MGVVNLILSWIMKKRIHQMELFIKYPHDVQHDVFKRLIQTAKNTTWGKKYDYASIQNVEQFKQRVPISNYEALEPFINRVMRGEQNLLWPSDVKWFAKSSGTTNDRSKFIPVTSEALEDCHFKGGKDMLSLYCNNFPETKIFDGKGLTLGGSHQINQLNNESYYGDLSAVLMQNLPFWVHFIRTPEMQVALLDKWEEKIKLIGLETANQEVTNIAGVPTWTLLLCKWLLEYRGKSNMLEIWPQFEVYFHGGVNFAPYKQQFQTLFPSKQVHYMETYNASEGFFGIQDLTDNPAMLLMLDYGIYFEFLPLDHLHNPNPQTLRLDQVVVGQAYALVISTNAGLWRYLIGDTIRFTQLNPFRFHITGRTKHFINAFGEELVVENAEIALAEACKATGASIAEYTAAPVYLSAKQPGYHQWLIEFDYPPTDLNRFTFLLDEALRRLNSDYDAKRTHDLAMLRPQVLLAPPLTFYNWLKSKNKLGGQNKVPRLNNDRSIMDAILAFTHSHTN